MATLDVSSKEFDEVKSSPIAGGERLSVSLGADLLILTKDQAGALSDELAEYSSDEDEDDIDVEDEDDDEDDED